MQWRMLRRRGASASWTIVGDPAQSSWTDTEEANRAIEEIIGTAPVRHFRLSTNYRSPSEVFDLAAKIVVADFPGRRPSHRGALNRSSAAALGAGRRRSGASDDRHSHDQHRADAARRGGGYRRRDLPAVNQGRAGGQLEQARLAGADRVAVVTPVEAKGLEYDGVLVVTPDDIVAESPGGVRALYVALTRPTQRLVTLDAAPDAGWRKSLE